MFQNPLRDWKFWVVMVTWLVSGVLAYASLASNINQNSYRLQRIESGQPAVTIDQYHDGQAAIEKRLSRIEDKLDNLQERKH